MAAVRDALRMRRMARVLVSDLATYCPEDVRLGLEKDDLFERFGPELERSRAYYRNQIDPDVPERERERVFDHAIVDVLVYAHRRVPTWIW